MSKTDCSNGWFRTDRNQGIANMVGWHNATTSQAVTNRYTDGSNLMVCLGSLVQRWLKPWLSASYRPSPGSTSSSPGWAGRIGCGRLGRPRREGAQGGSGSDRSGDAQEFAS
ncbi:hypothetical protein [Kitasatospora sp. NBC_01266]|uniref:hypothetical protein n=1 Tax=Kitasatospora sp. NBC_01266 TaxID=2903572 RepID=UPI002E3391CC|nr:hypothetical protein [Kitasatospora sp. NBC_01266]